MIDPDDRPPLEPIEGVFTDLGNARMVPPTWIIKDLLPPGLCILGAPPKSGKSTLTMAIAALSAGMKCNALPVFLSEVENGGPVIIFSYEATAGELRHMLEVGMKTKVEANEGIIVCDDPFAWRLDDPDGMAKLLGWLKARDPRICILDPLRDFHHLEEKDSGGMNRLLRPLRQWAVENNSAVIIVHHTRKKEDGGSGSYTADDLRGSGALYGVADCVLMLTPAAGGQLKMKATFKRAKGWERTVQFAAYEHAGERATEPLTEVDKLVLDAMSAGMTIVEDIARQVKLAKARACDILAKLERNGLVVKDGRGWKLKGDNK